MSSFFKQWCYQIQILVAFCGFVTDCLICAAMATGVVLHADKSEPVCRHVLILINQYIIMILNIYTVQMKHWSEQAAWMENQCLIYCAFLHVIDGNMGFGRSVGFISKHCNFLMLHNSTADRRCCHEATEGGLEGALSSSNISGICWWASPWSQRGLRRGSSTFWGLFAAERLYILQVIPEPAAPEKCFYGSKWSKGAVSISCEWAGCRNKECLCAHLLCQRSNVKTFPRFLTVWAPFACLLHFYLCSSLLGIDTHRHSRLWAI